ncbi:MAG TPA: hypothetical protein P5105_02815 [Victivallales bacterium]|nr:hypothetical protein [Victivallales bacterium]HPO90922.1 hypothetical protein [Victivallales bacterium]HRR06191.1 hypothetical protein [Victivallales bacterium]HRR27980.1 hypothetical protein [Victivallales bacterium]
MNWKYFYFSKRFFFVLLFQFCLYGSAQESNKLSPGQTITIKLDSLPPCLVELKSGKKVEAVMTATLPENYNSEGKFPVLLFLQGGEGGNGGNNNDASFFSDNKDFVALSLPLYKKTLNPSGIDIYINQNDFKYLADIYEKAFNLLRKEIPNLSDSDWVVGGFSNGAHSIAGILKSQKLRKLFKYFILAEGGSEISSIPNKCRAILFVGENSIYGKGMVVKDGKVVGFPNQFGSLKKKNVDFVPMIGIGHDFPEKYKIEAKEWLKAQLQKDNNKEK